MQGNHATWKTAAVAAVTVLAAACGSTAARGGSASTPASPGATGTRQVSAEMCQDAAALRTSLENIVSFRAGKEPVARLRADLADASTKLAALRGNPQGIWRPQIAALETSLKVLHSEAANPAVTARPAGIQRALTGVGPKARTFITSAKAQCHRV